MARSRVDRGLVVVGDPVREEHRGLGVGPVLRPARAPLPRRGRRRRAARRRHCRPPARARFEVGVAEGVERRTARWPRCRRRAPRAARAAWPGRRRPGCRRRPSRAWSSGDRTARPPVTLGGSRAEPPRPEGVDGRGRDGPGRRRVGPEPGHAQDWASECRISPLVRAIAANRRSADRSVSPFSSPAESLRWATFAVLGLILAAYVASLIVRRPDQSWTWLDGWVVCGIEVVASCAVHRPRPRPAPGSRGGARPRAQPAVLDRRRHRVDRRVARRGAAPRPRRWRMPSTCASTRCYVAVMLFMRGRGQEAHAAELAGRHHRRPRRRRRVRRLRVPQRSWPRRAAARSATMTSLAYPIGDLLLLGLVVGATPCCPGRRKAPWILLATGIGLNVVGDTFNLFSNTFGVLARRRRLQRDRLAHGHRRDVDRRSGCAGALPNPLAPVRPPGFVLPEVGGHRRALGAARRHLAVCRRGRDRAGNRDAAHRRSPTRAVGAGHAAAEPGAAPPVRHRRPDRARQPPLSVPCSRRLLR